MRLNATNSEEVSVEILDDTEYEGTNNEVFMILAALKEGVFGERMRLYPNFAELAIEENDLMPGMKDLLYQNSKLIHKINSVLAITYQCYRHSMLFTSER